MYAGLDRQQASGPVPTSLVVGLQGNSITLRLLFYSMLVEQAFFQLSHLLSPPYTCLKRVREVRGDERMLELSGPGFGRSRGTACW